jgi:pyridoxamine 5'-phosphate oxidase-like protein
MTPDDPEVRAVLARSMNVRVATLSSRGVPHITPLRFIEGDGVLYVLTRTVTLAARHVRAEPDVVLLFDAERTAGPVLRMRARASVRDDPERAAWCERRAARRYLLRPGAIWNILTHPWCLPAWIRSRRAARPEETALIAFVPVSAEFVARP